ncbi:TetR family transcriptional regulator, partial [Achromobacter xylosoxidans]|nr:TetR family transcriptional regulator [Achromobacter xylosoxidans]
MSPRNTGDASKGRRRYLPSTERKVEILEAALQEFSSNGYVNTTVERIGARAGLTKSGVYAHYRSKDEIFEEMLTRLLAPMEGEATWTPQEADSLPEIVDSYLDYVYSRLREPTVLAALRL